MNFLTISVTFLLISLSWVCEVKPSTNAYKSDPLERFSYAWHSYTNYSWGYDELIPGEMTGRNWYSQSMLITPIDSLDTLCIVGITKEAEAVRNLIIENFNEYIDDYVSVFEINIRVLGGLLSAYEICGYESLLKIAVRLADRLILAFNSPTGMPYGSLNLKTGQTMNSNAKPATIGTYILEFGQLSRITGDMKYMNIAKNAMVTLWKLRSPVGLVPWCVNIETGLSCSDDSSISGGIDSFYEYCLKGWLLFGNKDLLTMWKGFKTAVMRYVLQKWDKEPWMWYAHVNVNDGALRAPIYDALSAFWTGCLALDGDLNAANASQTINEFYWNMYGIEPDAYDYQDEFISTQAYLLRPETIESSYILYSVTGDKKYADTAEHMMNSIDKWCRCGSYEQCKGYCQLSSVIDKSKDLGSSMPSYLLAETMKYMYLLRNNSLISPKTHVFNTEGHPLRKII